MAGINERMLQGKIAEKGMTREGLASHVGVDRGTFSRRIKKNTLRICDIQKICDVLELTNEEAISIFLGK